MSRQQETYGLSTSESSNDAVAPELPYMPGIPQHYSPKSV